MTRVKDLTGQRFGQWSVLGFSHAKGTVAYWLCRCSCDAATERAVFGGDLKRGVSTSCGCEHKRIAAERFRSHDMSRHPAYGSWQHMKTRCMSAGGDSYHLYGGRGIKVCERWMSFENFWADMGAGWEKGKSIDRFPDRNGNYEPGNCRWATPKEQADNRRSERLVDTPVGSMSMTAAAQRYGLKRETIAKRVRSGVTDSALLVATPRDPHERRGPKRKRG